MEARDTGIYARISFDRRDGAGVDRQLEDCRELVARRGWDAEEFPDNNVSASRFSRKPRKEYARLLEAVRAGHVSRIVVWKTDRLYRKPRELEDLIDLAERGRVEVVAVMSGEIDLSTSDGRALARVLCAMDAKASDDTSVRIKRQKRQARERGRSSGGPRPFGWQADRVTPEPQEAQLVREAIDLIIGGRSLVHITKLWIERGVAQPVTGRAGWTPAVVRQVLQSPRHAGLIGYREEIRLPDGRVQYRRPAKIVGRGDWTPIVDPERWEQAMTIMAGRSVGPPGPRRRGELTGVLVCALCQTKMVRGGSDRHRRVWRCPTLRGCGRVTIAAIPLETMLTEALLWRFEHGGLRVLIDRESTASAPAQELIAEIDARRRRLDEASQSYDAGRISIATLERVTAAAETELARLQDRLTHQTNLGWLRPHLGKDDGIRAAWAGFSVDQRRALFARALREVVISPAIKHGIPRFDERRVDPRWRV